VEKVIAFHRCRTYEDIHGRAAAEEAAVKAANKKKR